MADDHEDAYADDAFEADADGGDAPTGIEAGVEGDGGSRSQRASFAESAPEQPEQPDNQRDQAPAQFFRPIPADAAPVQQVLVERNGTFVLVDADDTTASMFQLSLFF